MHGNGRVDRLWEDKELDIRELAVSGRVADGRCRIRVTLLVRKRLDGRVDIFGWILLPITVFLAIEDMRVIYHALCIVRYLHSSGR